MKQIHTKKTFFFLIVFMITSFSYGQSKPWKQDGNDVNSNSKLGTTNNNPLKIITNDLERITITEEGKVEVNDSMEVFGSLKVDSIHARTIKVGNHSLWIGGVGPWSPSGWGTQDLIQSTNGQIGFYNTDISSLSSFDDISLTLGGLPLHKLNMNDFESNPVYSSFTNLSVNSGLGGVLPTLTDGFLIGILATGDAILNQQENLSMFFNTSTLPRMQISNNANNGYVGIGDYSAFNPNNLLHLHEVNDVDVGMQVGKIGFENGLFVGVQQTGEALISHRENAPILMWSNDRERMRITQNADNVTRIGIPIGVDDIDQPLSLIHMGEDLLAGGAGHRAWMETGIFIYEDSDNAYFGLRDDGEDRKNTVINWGDNSSPVIGEGPDNLLFVFTSPFVGAGIHDNSTTNDGGEVARMNYQFGFGKMGICQPNPRARLHISVFDEPGEMTEDLSVKRNVQLKLSRGIGNVDFQEYETGNLTIFPYTFALGHDDPLPITTPKNVGIGPGFTMDLQPNRRLEVFDNEDKAQLRLTYKHSEEADGGRFTDFYTTAAGDLLINPFDYDNEEFPERNVGINLSDGEPPMVKLEVLENKDAPQLRLSYEYDSKFTDQYTTDVGDFLINSTNSQVGINLSDLDPPTQALDVFGNGRFRIMPVDNTVTDVVVIMPDGTLRKNTEIGGGIGGSDADWYEAGNTSPNHIDDDIFTYNNVCVGSSSSYSSRVYSFNGLDNSHHQVNEKYNIYANTLVDPTFPNTLIYGIFSYANSASTTSTVSKYAILGKTNCNANEHFSVGVKGEISGGSKNIGVWGVVPAGDIGNWAGLFDGNVQVNGNLVVTGTYPTSDVVFKENVQNIEDASDLINQLSPKTFDFKTEEYPRFNFSDGLQYGLIAQEVENIIPSLIKECYLPPLFDSLGNEIESEMQFKSLNYNAFIPILIQGFKEQQDTIESLKEIINTYETRFQQIEATLAMCCEGAGAKSQQVEINSTTIAIETDGSLLENSTQLNQNNPNPFTYKTTFTYSIGNAGFVELEITDQYGRFIEKLVDTNQDSGNYSFDWNAEDIAPGIYFYSLKVDGMMWVKKAIKIK